MPHRKHIRLRGFDYSSGNSYFLTICVKNLQQLFGNIHNNIMRLSDIGNTACVFLQEIPVIRNNISLDEFMIMPNHIHCILDIKRNETGLHRPNQFAKPVSGSISVIVNQYKGAVKKWCNANGHEYFEWQARFYDHVIRCGESYHNIRNYIATNPHNWKTDRFYRNDLPPANLARRIDDL